MNSSFLDNKFMDAVDAAADLVILSLLWALCSLPVVTAGAASAALFHTIQKAPQQRGSAALSYFLVFRDNLGFAFPAGAVLMPATLLAAYGVCVSFNGGKEVWGVPMVMCVVVLLLLLSTQTYLYPLAGHFTLTPGQILSLTVVLMVRHLPQSLCLLCLLLASIWAFRLYPPLIAVLPAVYTLLSGKILMGLFPKYIRFVQDGAEKIDNS